MTTVRRHTIFLMFFFFKQSHSNTPILQCENWRVILTSTVLAVIEQGQYRASTYYLMEGMLRCGFNQCHYSFETSLEKLKFWFPRYSLSTGLIWSKLCHSNALGIITSNKATTLNSH